MLNAGLDMNFVPLSIALAVTQEGVLLADPVQVEEKAARSTAVSPRP